MQKRCGACSYVYERHPKVLPGEAVRLQGGYRYTSGPRCTPSNTMFPVLVAHTGLGNWGGGGSIGMSMKPGNASNWNESRLLQALSKGVWRVPPVSPRNWEATGLCFWEPAFEAGHMAVLRPEGGKLGMPLSLMKRLRFMPQTILVERGDRTPLEDLPPTPVFEVPDVSKAVLELGAYARDQMAGKVIGVTGSAGKTTVVAMLAAALRPWGEVARTRHNANLPHGIAWNLASMSWSAPFAVVEMAIGRMRQNALMVKPDVAVFTNIGPAHLEYHISTEEVAKKKARIFEGMSEGGIAVLNRDMEHWETIEQLAVERGLRVVNYGQHADAQIRLLKHDAQSRWVRVQTPVGSLEYIVGSPGVHVALNSLACLSVLYALGMPIGPGVSQFELFDSLEGRGAVEDVVYSGRCIRLIDDAYNANPSSMKAALQSMMGHVPLSSASRRVLVLGDMLELGADSIQFHVGLEPDIRALQPDVVLLCGQQMQPLSERIHDLCQVRWYVNVDALNRDVHGLLQEGDLVLVKSSGGTRLSETVSMLRSRL